MFNIKIKGILTIAAFLGLLATTACNKLCDSGYEGKRCNVLSTTKYVAAWNAIDTPGNLIYIDTITQGAALGDITLSTSFAGHHFNHVINASVVLTAITIPNQQPDSGGNFIQGTGKINSDNSQISFSYQIISGTDTPQIITNYSGIWTRQN